MVNRILKRAIAAVGVLLLLTGLPMAGFAADDDSSSSSSSSSSSTNSAYKKSNKHALILMDAGAESPKAAPGKVVEIVLPIAVNREYLPAEQYVLRNITIEPVIPTEKKSIDQWPFDLINASYVRHLDDMTFNSTATVHYEFRISHLAEKGAYPVNFKVRATVWRDDEFYDTAIEEDVEFTLGVYVTITDDGGESGKVSGIGPLNVGGTIDGEGAVQTPVGQPGQTVTMFIPVVNKGGKLTNVTVSPVISTNVEEFPFIAEQINYGRDLADMKTGKQVTLDFTFKISPYATTGNKLVQFRATYKENGVYGECAFSSYIYIESGYEEIADTPPVVTVNGYQLMVRENPVDSLSAGEEAILKVLLLNNSQQESVYKTASTIVLQDTDTLALSTGSSDTAYVSQIAPGETVELEYRVAARASALAGPSVVGVDIRYENWDVVQGTAKQTIMLPVKQPMKVIIDEPIFDEVQKQAKPFTVSLNIINMGRGKVYNLYVAAMDGLTMDEAFFGGDILPAGTLNADVQVRSNKTGAFTGKLLVNYEDNEGEPYTQEIALPIDCAEEQGPPDPQPQSADDGRPKSGNLSKAVAGTAAGLTVLGGGGGYCFNHIRRRKR